MKKAVVSIVVVLLLAAAGIAWCWSVREKPDFRRANRRAALKTMRDSKPDDVVPYLKSLLARRVFRAWFDDDKFSVFGMHIAYETWVPTDFVAQLTEEAFIRFAGNGKQNSEDIPHLKELLAFSGHALAACSTKAAADSLRLRRLDGYFLTKDYDGAIAEIERGLPGQTPEWCKATVSKLRAHKALDAGDKKAAIGHFLAFGEFMQGESMKDFEDCDPTSGVIYSREWVVGRTFVRCAKLAEELGDSAQALKLRTSAKPYMDKALEKAADDRRSYDALKEEIKSSGL